MSSHCDGPVAIVGNLYSAISAYKASCLFVEF